MGKAIATETSPTPGAYRVIWYGKRGELARQEFVNEASARRHVNDMLPIRIITAEIELVEVWTSEGKLLSRQSGQQPESHNVSDRSRGSKDEKGQEQAR